jgi:adenosine deaminase
LFTARLVRDEWPGGGRAERLTHIERGAAHRARICSSQQEPVGIARLLQGMPKAADLHLHMSGGTVYSETLIGDAVQDGLCVKTATMTLIKPQGSCGEGAVPAANALKDQNLYDAMVNAFSMRYFVPSSGISGHDQFFATFDRFEALGKSHDGEWVDEIATRAQEQNEQYIEAMYTPCLPTRPNLDTRLAGAVTRPRT